MTRRAWISQEDEVSVVRQCALAAVSRATFYARQLAQPVDGIDLLLRRLIDEEYTRHPFYGSRKMVIFLKAMGHTVNRKRVQRLMREMGLVALAPGPNTSRPHPEHQVYPYLLRGVPVIRPNQVWSTDISVPQQAAQEMRVWPLAIGLQEQVANHHERLGSKAPVVSVMEKASRRRQVWIKEDEQP